MCEKTFLTEHCLVQQTTCSTHVGEASSQLQHGAGWPAGIPVLTPLHSQTATLGHSGPHASTSRGSAVSALLTHGSTHTNTTLLVPKTEKLSPVQLYGTDRSSLSGRTSLLQHNTPWLFKIYTAERIKQPQGTESFKFHYLYAHIAVHSSALIFNTK